jgi:hypothetical protein
MANAEVRPRAVASRGTMHALIMADLRSRDRTGRLIGVGR